PQGDRALEIADDLRRDGYRAAGFAIDFDAEIQQGIIIAGRVAKVTGQIEGRVIALAGREVDDSGDGVAGEEQVLAVQVAVNDLRFVSRRERRRLEAGEMLLSFACALFVVAGAVY